MKRHLLVADSNPCTARAFENYFTKAGYRVETVGDGLSCVGRLRHDIPDLLLLDQGLPWGGGDGVLARLREETWPGRIPVIVIADMIPFHLLSRLTTPPVIRYLAKKCPLPALRYTIDTVLASSLERGALHAERPQAAPRPAILLSRPREADFAELART